MSDFKKEKNILSELSRAREAIKRKYSLLKQEKDNFEKVIGDTLKPVITPLEKLIDSKTASLQPSKDILDIDTIRKSKKSRRKLRFDRSNNTSSQFDDQIEDDDFDEDDDDEFASLDGTMLNSTFKSTHDTNQSTNYISLLNESRSKLDNIYGVRDVNGVYMIGDSRIIFNDKTINLKGRSYPKSDGLMELLFKKQPDENLISSADQDNYRSILEATNAHRKKHSKDEALRSSRSRKYANIIAPMFRSTRKNVKTVGGGCLLPKYKIAKKNSSIDLVYWDDPNELVERLQLLIAERSAGNNNHTNEIQSIIEELREGGHIY